MRLEMPPATDSSHRWLRTKAGSRLRTRYRGGYLKLVFDAAQEWLLGAQMVSYAGAELVQTAALALRTGATASVLAAQLSVHPSHAERFIKVAAHDYHEICEVVRPLR
jgi:pyruvate/2-oxoglutarate dehydrogenase complex dihydrolipoamide dehydrogenase (E3) component